jgi:hypothetical protein
MKVIIKIKDNVSVKKIKDLLKYCSEFAEEIEVSD